MASRCRCPRPPRAPARSRRACAAPRRRGCGDRRRRPTRARARAMTRRRGRAGRARRAARRRGEAGGRAYLGGAGLPHLGHVECVGELVGIDAVAPGGYADDRVPIGHEDDRLGDLRLLAADRHRGVLHGSGGRGQALNVDLEPQLTCALGQTRSHTPTRSAACSSTPAARASSASESSRSTARSSRSHSRSKSPTRPKLMRPS